VDECEPLAGGISALDGGIAELVKKFKAGTLELRELKAGAYTRPLFSST